MRATSPGRLGIKISWVFHWRACWVSLQIFQSLTKTRKATTLPSARWEPSRIPVANLNCRRFTSAGTGTWYSTLADPRTGGCCHKAMRESPSQVASPTRTSMPAGSWSAVTVARRKCSTKSKLQPQSLSVAGSGPSRHFRYSMKRASSARLSGVSVSSWLAISSKVAIPIFLSCNRGDITPLVMTPSP